MEPASTRPTARWRGLDAFRGLAIIGMLLVNAPGNADAVYSQLEHSKWNGCTFADLVFPSFLFVVGITTAISLGAMRNRDDAVARARIWRRAAILFGVGLLLNWFPFYQSGDISWTGHHGFLGRVIARLLLLRVPGVMQRIAVAYLAAALVARRASSRTIAIITAALLIGYWLLLTVVPVPGEGVRGAQLLDQPSRTIVAHLDRTLFDWTRWGLGNHLWDSALTWDPEGVLSTLPAIATVLLGVLCARWTLGEQHDRIRKLVIAGGIAIVVGWCWSLVFPLNKSLWTSSYVLFTAGIAAVVLGALSLVVDGDSVARWAKLLIVFGENPLIAYAGSEVTRRILHSSLKVRTPTGRLGLDEWVTLQLTHVGLTDKAASLAWSLLFVAAWWLVLRRLSRRRLFVSA
jgi:predicted acyltransferase